MRFVDNWPQNNKLITPDFEVRAKNMQLARTARKQLETDAKCENDAMHGKTP